MKLSELERIAAVVALEADIPLESALHLLADAAVRAGVMSRTAHSPDMGHSPLCPCDRCAWLREIGVTWEQPSARKRVPLMFLEMLSMKLARFAGKRERS